jgi:hypothetical protein
VNIRQKPDRFDSAINAAFEEAEDLLEGYNYTVFLIHYFSPGQQADLLAHLSAVLPTRDIEIGSSSEVTVDEAITEISEAMTHRGDSSYGPIPEKIDSERYRNLVARLLEDCRVLFDAGDRIEVFWLKNGHPAYPVFWDFAFAVHTGDGLHIIMGSSSD